MTSIRTSGLTKDFGEQRAVDNVSIELPRGQVIGFVGPNGSGKSTTIRMLLGLIEPSAGGAEILGSSIQSPAAYLSRVGSLIEGPAFHPSLTGEENLRLLATLGGYSRQRISEVIETVGLTGRAGDRFRQYSLGMKQRLGIAAALLPDPDLLILDEPTNGLDPEGIVEIRHLLMNLGEEGKTVFVSSHLLSEISQICDRILMIQEGEIIGEGPEEELAQQFTRKIRVRMQVRGARSEIEGCLQDLPEVEEIEWVREKAGRSSFVLSLSEDVRETISLKLASCGVGLLEMVRTDLDLENTFLRLMLKEEEPS